MRKLLLFILLCGIQYTYAQQFTLTGKIRQPSRNFVVLTSVFPLSGVTKTDTIRLDLQNEFTFNLKTGGRFVTLILSVDSIMKSQFMAIDGDHCTIDIAGDAIKIKGDGSRIKAFLDVEHEQFKQIYKAYLKRNPLLETDSFSRTDGYFTVHDSITLGRIDFLDTFFKQPNKLEQRYIAYMKAGYRYNDLFYKQSYTEPPLYKFKFYRDKYTSLTGYTYKFSDLVNFNDPELCYNSYYQRFITSFLTSELQLRRKKENTKFSWEGVAEKGFKLIDELSTNRVANNNLKIVLLAFFAQDLERSKGVEGARKVLEVMDKTYLGENVGEIAQLRGKLKILINDRRFTNGSPAQDFTLVDPAGKIFKLSDFKGKRLVFDISASWCGPCIAYIPEWNKMVEENKDSETIYIYLSLDDSVAVWNKFRKEHPAKGLQLYAGIGGFKSKFAVDYFIKALPDKVIIDRNGNIENKN